MHMVTPCCEDLLPAHLKLSLEFFKLCGLAFIVPAYLWYELVLKAGLHDTTASLQRGDADVIW